MTRFARYSTKGIQKPPCAATPWSEMAPPAAAKFSEGAANSSPRLKREDEELASTKDKDQTKIINGTKTGKKKKVQLANLAERKKGKGKAPLTIDAETISPETCDDGIDDAGILGKNSKSKKGLKRKHAETSIGHTKRKKGDAEAKIDEQASASSSQDDGQEQLNDKTSDDGPNLKAGKQNGRGNFLQKKKKKKPKSMKKPLPASPSDPPLLTENSIMTQFEGYWVRRRAVPRLEKIRAELAAAIADPQTLKREMKKRKRAEHRNLLSLLAAKGAGRPSSAAGRIQAQGEDSAGEDEDAGVEDEDAGAEDEEEGKKAQPAAGDESEDEGSPVKKKSKTDDDSPLPRQARGAEPGPQKEERMVKFDGVWMTSDAVGRLKELRRKLKLQRVSETVLKQTMKTARRREEMKRKRDAKRVCLACRQRGHLVGECPQRTGNHTPVTGLCFRCGSTEHRLSECRAKQGDGRLPFAVCFVCGQTGHLSRECSVNPNGVYPRGGACKLCHQRSHLAEHCPERKEQEEAATAPRLGVMGDGGVEEDYQHDFRAAPAAPEAAAAPAARKPRLVKF